MKLVVDPIPLNKAFARLSKQIDVPAETDIEAPKSSEMILNTELRKPFRISSYRKVMDSPDGTYHLMMELASLQITDHPLISEEFKVAKNLESLMELWNSRRKSKIIDFLNNKLRVNDTFHSQSGFKK